MAHCLHCLCCQSVFFAMLILQQTSHVKHVRTVSQSSSFPFLRLRHGLIVYSLKQMLPRWISCKCEEIFRRTKNKQTSVNDLFWTGKTEKEEKTKGPVYFCRWCQICATMTFCEECFCRLNDQWKYEMPTPEWHSSHLPVKFTFWRWFWSSLWPSLSLSLSFSLYYVSLTLTPQQKQCLNLFPLNGSLHSNGICWIKKKANCIFSVPSSFFFSFFFLTDRFLP